MQGPQLLERCHRRPEQDARDRHVVKCWNQGGDSIRIRHNGLGPAGLDRPRTFRGASRAADGMTRGDEVPGQKLAAASASDDQAARHARSAIRRGSVPDIRTRSKLVAGLLTSAFG